jgi:hypothetical protein
MSQKRSSLMKNIKVRGLNKPWERIGLKEANEQVKMVMTLSPPPAKQPF